MACGVGGLIAIAVVIAIWCSCCRKKKTKKPVSSAGPKDGDLEEGSPVGAADVYKTELWASQQHPPPPSYQVIGSQKLSAQAHNVQAVPMAMLEPQDLAQSGPLASGAIVAGQQPPARRPASSASSQRSGSVMLNKSSTTTRREPSGLPPGSLPMAPAKTEYNDALLTWIGGQLSKEKEGSGSGSGMSALNTEQQQQRQYMKRTSTTTKPKFDDISVYAIPFDALRMGRLVGEGSFGKVYLASWNETPVAVKVLVDTASALDNARPHALRRLAEPVLDKLSAEAGLMASMRHPNIIQFMGIVSMPPCVVTEYCERGSLTDVLRRGRRGEEALGWRLRLGMAVDAATGMLYLHARPQPIIHRDLKSPNLLVDSHWRVKVCDFNMSRIMEESGQASSLAGTNPRWLAPELMAGESASIASDIFAFGVVMWELLTWQLPWGKDNPWSVAHTVGNGGRLGIPPRWELPGPDNAAFGPQRMDAYIDLMQRCWAQNPYDRPSFGEAIRELRALMEGLPVPLQQEYSEGSPVQLSGTAGGTAAGVKKSGTVGGTGTVRAPSTVSGVEPVVAVNQHHQEDVDDAYLEGVDEGVYDSDYYHDDNVDTAASISSTAVVASMDHTASLPNWLSRGVGSWGSGKKKG